MVAKTIASRRSKGNQFQKDIAKKIQFHFGLEESDVVSTPSACKGVDIILSNKAKSVFNFGVEVKRQESIAIWSCIEQSEKNAGDAIPLLVFKRNRSDTYCCLKFDAFLKLITGDK